MSKTLVFVNDTKLHRVITNEQEKLLNGNNLYNWSADWLMLVPCTHKIRKTAALQ